MMKGQPRFRGSDFVEWLSPRIVVRDAGHGTPCWLWAFKPNRKGYASAIIPKVFRTTSRAVRIHRLTFEQFVGPIPDGLVIDHLCRNRACVNPEHLEPVTNAENAKRGSAHFVPKTHCKYGHEISGENIVERRPYGRRCRICQNKAGRDSRARRRAAPLVSGVVA